MSVLLAENAERRSALPALTDSKNVKNPFHVKQGTESSGRFFDMVTDVFHVNHRS
jgi:hypothetical protein